jgi:hypothetical protein
MEYVVVEEFDPDAISKRVEELLNDGWELHGNLQFSAYYAKGDEIEHRTTFVQALTKKKKNRPIGALGLGAARRKSPV